MRTRVIFRIAAAAFLLIALASAGLLTGLAGASPVINAQFEKAALTFTASLSDASPSSGDE